MIINRLHFFILSFFCLFLACEKSAKSNLSWEKINLPTSDALQKIAFTDAQNGFIVGGKTWERGICLQTSDGGKIWQKDSLQNQSLYGLGVDTEGVMLTTGLIGQVFRRQPTDPTFKLVASPTWLWFRDVAARKKNQGFVAVGGAAWEHGKIFRVFSDGSSQIDSFRQSLYSVCFSDDSTLHTVGYGIVVRSTDSGKKWVINDVKGDFFQSICFPTAEIGFVVGLNGTILKTIDAGKTWQKLRNGNAITVSDAPFRAVFFADILRGCIVGDEGLLWLTSDGGETWEVQTGLPEADFYDVFVDRTNGWIVGTGGTLIRFDFL